MATEQGLEARWLAGDPVACTELAASLTTRDLKVFAVDALAACCIAVGKVPAAVQQVVEIGRVDPRLGHEAFAAVRKLTLAADSEHLLPRADEILSVAENAAKVIYNATSPEDPFDLDSGEWLFRTTASLCQALPNGHGQALAQELSLVFRRVISLSDPAEGTPADDWAKRWLVGDVAATRLLASSMTTDQQEAFAVEALAACCATFDNPPTAILRLVELGRTDRRQPPVVLDGLKAAATALRGEPQPNSAEGRLWSIAENVLAVMHNATNPPDLFDAAAGYYLLISVVLFYRSLPVDGRDSLGPRLSRLAVPSGAASNRPERYS